MPETNKQKKNGDDYLGRELKFLASPSKVKTLNLIRYVDRF